MNTKEQTASRTARVERKTKETEIRVSLNLDGSGASHVATGIAFLDHMLSLFARHGLFDLEVDDHHSVEDIAIALGAAFSQALGDKTGITRYGAAMVPMDEALCRACV